MKKKILIVGDRHYEVVDGDYLTFDLENKYLSVRYRCDGDEIEDVSNWYIMGVDVYEEPFKKNVEYDGFLVRRKTKK